MPKAQRISPSAKMRLYNEKDCRCPIHASHGGCSFSSRVDHVACNCEPSATTLSAYTPQPPPQESYFERTFGNELFKARRQGRRAF